MLTLHNAHKWKKTVVLPLQFSLYDLHSKNSQNLGCILEPEHLSLFAIKLSHGALEV